MPQPGALLQPKPGSPQAPVPPPGPQAGPMAQPTPNEGKKQLGMVSVDAATKLLAQGLTHFGANSPEGDAVIRALGILSKHFGQARTGELLPAQMKEMNRAVPGGAPPPGPPAGMPPPGMPGMPQ